MVASVVGCLDNRLYPSVITRRDTGTKTKKALKPRGVSGPAVDFVLQICYPTHPPNPTIRGQKKKIPKAEMQQSSSVGSFLVLEKRGTPARIEAGLPTESAAASDGSPSAALEQPHRTITHWITSFLSGLCTAALGTAVYRYFARHATFA